MVNRPGLRARRWVRRALDRLEQEGSGKPLITLNLAARWHAPSPDAQRNDPSLLLIEASLPVPNS
jgi:hypothetical protein